MEPDHRWIGLAANFRGGLEACFLDFEGGYQQDD